MISLDGSFGEGGGQILRSALALSVATRTPFRMERIRAGRARPGLLRQHLTALRAAAAISEAEVEGAELRSQQITFRPHAVAAGEYTFAVGSAGSAGLVLQTVLPPLLTAAGRSRLVLEGGTHNPMAPPFDFLAKAFLPLLGRMGARVDARLERPGFYPAGGGRFSVTVTPVPSLARLDLLQRGELRTRRARALVAKLPRHIGERELKVVQRELGWDESCLSLESIGDAAGPGNVLILEIESEHVTEVFTGFGEVHVRAETVAERATREAQRYLESGVPIGQHLADQMLLPLGLAGGGSFRTLALTRHTTTNIEVLRRFLDLHVTVSPSGPDDLLVQIDGVPRDPV